MKNKKTVEIVIPSIEMSRMELWLIGLSPLLINKFGINSLHAIEDKQQGVEIDGPRKARVPQQELEEAFYLDKEGHCVLPAGAFRKAAVSACRHLGIQMTSARGIFYILGDGNVRLYGSDPTGEVHIGRINGRTPIPRYRPMFEDWAVKLHIEYVRSLMTEKQIVNLLHWAGSTIGVFEWRPEKGGDLGRFRVAQSGEEKRYENRLPNYKAAKVTSAQERVAQYAIETGRGHTTDGVAGASEEVAPKKRGSSKTNGGART